MQEELLKLKNEMKDLRELFNSCMTHKPLNEETLKTIFEEYFRNKEMLEELKFIRFGVFTALFVGIFGVLMMMWLAV